MYPNAKPPIKAAINPLPPSASATRNVSIAFASHRWSCLGAAEVE